MYRLLALALATAGLLALMGCGALQAGQSGTGSVALGNSSLDFGSVAVGSTKTLSDTITNNASSSVTIAAIQGTGSNFKISGITLPLTVASGQTVSFNVQYQPAATGSAAVTISFQDQNSQSMVSLTATAEGVTIGQLSANPTQVNFGNTKVGTNQTASVLLTNTGGSDLTINSATMSGAGFSLTGSAPPVTLQAGASTSFTVIFAPPASGSYSGSVTFATTSDDQNASLVVSFSGGGVSPGTLTAIPSTIAFGSIQVGTTSNKSETLTNTGATTVNISQASVSGSGYSISGLSLPAALNPNQSTTFTVSFDPTATGTANGSVTVTSDASNSPLTIALSGTGLAAGSLTANPTSVNFGNVSVGSNQSISVTVTNTGGTSVSVSGASTSGSAFSFTGPSLPLSLAAGQSTTFNAIFTPASAGAASGTLTINSNAQNPTLTVPLSGTGVAQGQLGSNPTSFSFGNIQIGASKSLSGTLTNSGGTSVTISAASASGTGFSLSGLSVPLTLSAGQSASFSVLFSPTAAGAASGSVSITSNGGNPNLSIPLSGTGVTQGTLTPGSSSMTFGNVQVGNNSSLSESVTNTGGSSVTISQAAVTGTGFSISGLTIPTTLNANQSVTFTATFTPAAAGTTSGTISITSNASNSPLNIGLSGTGTATGTLTVSPASLSFGNVTVGSNSTLNGTLTASGASVTISSASVNNNEFALSGISLPVTLAAGQSAPFSVTFTPQATGATAASLTFTSNASNSPATQSMSGTGTAPTQHNVDLTWNVASGASGYNVYRSTVSGGPYTMINSTLDATNAYTDSTVVSGQTYYYVATEVNSQNQESGYSNQVQAVIPTP